MDNFQTEKELHCSTSTSQEAKFKEVDSKMTNEIEKQTAGQSRSLLIKMWQEDCSRNEEISRKRWDETRTKVTQKQQ